MLSAAEETSGWKEVINMKGRPQWKYLVAVKGKGTAKEQRIKTKVRLYRSKTIQRWVSIPD
jgi:hypothetical protein